MTVCVENSEHSVIIDSGAHFSIVVREYLEKHFPNWENRAFSTRAKNLKSASIKMTSIGTIIRKIIILYRQGNIRLNQDSVVLEDAHIQGFLLGTDYQRMYGIDIYNSKNRHITIEAKFSSNLTSKQKLSLLKILRKNRTAFAIGEEALGKIRGHGIALYLDVERTYPHILGRTTYTASLKARKEIEKNFNKLLDIDVIRKIGHNEIVKVSTPALIIWNDGKSKFSGDFIALNNYIKAELPYNKDTPFSR
ncbi:hypothetical protein O181_069868 [Austropuccinia psidii MF-1]|uniref:Uncharacterized protein n=1 Tax=Austropuccinia psidii MF-1 TaxID=1389203 RepID=A0A9Q3I6R4_9BASI|nr:hypothetical protein [Austropuccinia psidii MF-1]